MNNLVDPWTFHRPEKILVPQLDSENYLSNYLVVKTQDLQQNVPEPAGRQRPGPNVM